MLLILLAKSASIHPRTSRSKFADTSLPTPRVGNPALVADVLDKGVEPLDDERDEVILESVRHDHAPSPIVPAPVRTSEPGSMDF